MARALAKLTGTVEALGQSSIHRDGCVYSYIRFLEADGTVSTYDHVLVANGVGSNLDIDASGDFYLARVGKGAWLFAVATRGRRAEDVRFFGKVKGRNVFKGTLWVLLGLVTSIFVIGIPLLIFGLVALIQFLRWPSEGELRSMAFT